MNEITASIDTNLVAAPVLPFAQPHNLGTLAPASETEGNPFAMFFDAALNVVNDTNTIQLQANQMQLDFATGRMDDILAVQLAMGRASDSLTFTTQITNRIIEAYREIMRMQI